MEVFIFDKNNAKIYFTDVNGNEKALEYRYLEYNSDGYVVAIYNEMPVNITNSNKIAIADNRNFEVGYEYENYICVQEVNQDNILTLCCVIKQPESVKFLRKERDNLANALLEAQNAINALLGV
ncbi:hypothetical protein [Clostridium sp. OS1-26]|uniref:hypothetical protein n=1 Tax=Clostridium sp. OS1-26 TaxID=3070681 RepID=UPI0027DF9ECA|nr:hypothetical protein [Clostridium sp. OS1-26]WML35938.1 hypothetical protein RCG18_04105 [Clostridium sp. OS1-26]